MKGISFKYGIMAVLFILVHAAPLLAQSIWTDSGFKKSISIEVLFPSFKTSPGETIDNHTGFLSMRLPIGENKHLVVELPYSSGKISGSYYDYYSNSYYDYSESGEAIGNLYIGIEGPEETNNSFVEFGIRLPTSSEEEEASNLLGVLTDIERFDAFIVDYIAIKSALNARTRLGNSVIGRFRAAPSLWVNPDINTTRDRIEFLFTTSGQIWFDNGKLNLGGGLSIVAILTESALIYNNQSFFQLGMSASYAFNNIKPGFYMRFPLDDDLKDVVNNVIGLNIQWLIR